MTEASETPSSELHQALRVVMMPRDTNQYGTIFGGVILSYIDQAAFIEARRHGKHRWVTVSVDTVEFRQPVCVGDVVVFLTEPERLGTTSARVRIRVEAERYYSGERVHVTDALLTMVAVDSKGNPVPFRNPPTVTPSDLELRVSGVDAPGGSPA
ncbi:MAG: acyl-CoA thioesterase [Phycisphaerales bacterium]